MSITDSNIRYPKLRQKWRKYYHIFEVDQHLAWVANETEKDRKELSSLTSKFEALSRDDLSRKARLSSIEEQLSRQAVELEEKKQELDQTRNELMKSHIENTRQREEIAQQTIELAKSYTRIEKLNELIARLESKNTEELILDAENRASSIVAHAVSDSEKMLQQINEQRARVVSASRAAYYNALQFKQELADRFHRMEQELDTSIDILRIMENSRLTLTQLADSPRIVNEHGSVIS